MLDGQKVKRVSALNEGALSVIYSRNFSFEDLLSSRSQSVGGSSLQFNSLLGDKLQLDSNRYAFNKTESRDPKDHTILISDRFKIEPDDEPYSIDPTCVLTKPSVESTARRALGSGPTRQTENNRPVV